VPVQALLARVTADTLAALYPETAARALARADM
jgi:hypothetical protein